MARYTHSKLGLHHDNARLHTAKFIQQKLAEIHCKSFTLRFYYVWTCERNDRRLEFRRWWRRKIVRVQFIGFLRNLLHFTAMGWKNFGFDEKKCFNKKRLWTKIFLFVDYFILVFSHDILSIQIASHHFYFR